MTNQASPDHDISLITAARTTEHHRQLVLTTGTYSLRDLASLNPEYTNDWVGTQVVKHSLLVIFFDDRVIIPSFQFDHGVMRPELIPLLKELGRVAFSPFSTWIWITSRTSLLSGGRPFEVAVTNPERALRATARFTAWITNPWTRHDPEENE